MSFGYFWSYLTFSRVRIELHLILKKKFFSLGTNYFFLTLYISEARILLIKPWFGQILILIKPMKVIIMINNLRKIFLVARKNNSPEFNLIEEFRNTLKMSSFLWNQFSLNIRNYAKSLTFIYLILPNLSNRLLKQKNSLP